VRQIQQNPALAGYQVKLYRNQGGIIRVRLNSLLNNGMLGALLAAVVLYFFLRQFRLTLIIAMAIPLCLLISTTMMFFADESLNTQTILGLVICVGLLVDNSVVVAENIQRHYMDGLSRRDACLKGVGEIGLAVTTATLTTIIVFLPSLLIDGEMRFMLYRLALPVVSALLASLGIALVFIPLCVYMTLPPATTGTRRLAKPGRAVIDTCLAFRANTKKCLAFLYENTFARFNQWYNRAHGHRQN
jgi:HAE1 family hydrophobic/amphiphilic exporter-1